MYFIANGIDPSRLTSVGYGLDRPIADNGTEAGRSEEPADGIPPVDGRRRRAGEEERLGPPAVDRGRLGPPAPDEALAGCHRTGGFALP